MPSNQNSDLPPWHALTAEEVLQRLQCDRNGLTEAQARQRREEYGPNRLRREKGRGPLARFLAQFNNILIYILLAAAVVSGLLGEWIDTWVIVAVVLIIAVIGFFQEGKAEQALESIRRMLSLEAKVRRDGRERTIDAEELVPGDIVLLKTGGKVPADLRLLEVRDVLAEEAMLTGESEPVPKSPEPVEAEAAIGDRQCMAYSGTLLTSGTLEGVVVATGDLSEIGRIGRLVAEVEELTTPLLRKMDRFGRWLSGAILAFGVVVFLLGVFVRGYPPGQMLMIVVSLAVAAIPEGLPAVMTITLALGVQTMARRHAIIRRLPAVETLGSVTVICSDKTGTLTRNEMTVKRIATTGELLAVTGTGYQPQGELRRGDQPVSLADLPQAAELVRTALLCSDARLLQDEESGEWRIDGQPTEGAMVVLGRKAGLTREAEEQKSPRLDTIPFKSENRFMATLHRTPAPGGTAIFLKGGPERLLGLCDTQQGDQGEEPLDRSFWQQRIEEGTGQGHRLLAVARKAGGEGQERLAEADVQGGFTLLGLLGLIDPPREEAIEAIEKCRQAGIRVKMITGDHALTARSIGAQMGIGDGRSAVTGRQVEETGAEELQQLVQENDVFARSSPEHKIRLVEALQARGEIVAMTGDGVNDAPSLKRADIGIAMGIKGSEAAKDAAHMVLTDDNFASIEKAVEEGRGVFDNLTKTILFILPASGAQSLTIISAVLFDLAVMPVTPLQILWVNLVVATTLGMALAFEPAEADIMQRPPRRQNEPILSGHLLWRTVFVSVLIAALTLALFLRQFGTIPAEQARTLAVNVLVVGQLVYLFNSRFLLRPSFTLQGLRGNRVAWLAAGSLIVLQLAFTYAPPFQRWFGTAGLDGGQWLQAAGAGLAVFVLVELEKGVIRWRRHRQRQDSSGTS